MKYGFVTFEQAKSAYEAIENSKQDESIKHYDVSFGGRREFCKAVYADLGKFFEKSCFETLRLECFSFLQITLRWTVGIHVEIDQWLP